MAMEINEGGSQKGLEIQPQKKEIYKILRKFDFSIYSKDSQKLLKIIFPVLEEIVKFTNNFFIIGLVRELLTKLLSNKNECQFRETTYVPNPDMRSAIEEAP